MKIRTKVSLLTSAVFLSVILIASLSVWTTNEITRLRDTIESGVELINRAQRLHGLMKDLMFDLFTPQTYRLLKDVLYTPRFQTARRDFRSAVLDFDSSVAAFMQSPRVKGMLRDQELRDAYDVAQIMIAKASERIDSFQEAIDRLYQYGAPTEDSLYKRLQTDAEEEFPRFFEEVRETSYYLTNSFESFLSHFIRSLKQESVAIQRQILVLFWAAAAGIGAVAISLSLLFARRLSQRIWKIQEGFRLVSQGDFTTRLDERTGDELGVLAARFNLFLGDLKRNIDSVQNLLRDVGQSITRRSGFDRIVELIVEASVNDSNADGAAVLMAETGDRLRVVRSAGRFPYPSGGQVPPGGTAGGDGGGIDIREIFSRMETVHVRERRSLDGGGEVGSLLALPLAVPQGGSAMLVAITEPSGPALTDLDRTNFETFVGYAALIIDNFFKHTELLERREAEYRALQSQIQPHFLYNVLNGLVGLNRMGDAKALENAIFSLKDMLRYILEKADRTTVGEEFAFLGRYCELQRMRFAERLALHIRCDPRAAAFRIPKLLLQPLVENAVIHGIEPLDRPGHLSIEAAVTRVDGKDTLRILVEDDGIGFCGREGTAGSIGIANVRKRMRIAFPDARLSIEGGPGAGTRVCMELPEVENGCSGLDRG
jgi:sensor histidine kinase YesM